MPIALEDIAVTLNFTGAHAGTTVGEGDAVAALAAAAAAAALSAAAACSTVGTCTQAAPL
ncbi:unannotated protein [freshwater metagenome]|uniref:Unannotated protein n=1 Tax=freshwater metagenome TaxID=449393 RepID=A0A6J7PX86_9ZZZZ